MGDFRVVHGQLLRICPPASWHFGSAVSRKLNRVSNARVNWSGFATGGHDTPTNGRQQSRASANCSVHLSKSIPSPPASEMNSSQVSEAPLTSFEWRSVIVKDRGTGQRSRRESCPYDLAHPQSPASHGRGTPKTLPPPHSACRGQRSTSACHFSGDAGASK